MDWILIVLAILFCIFAIQFVDRPVAILFSHSVIYRNQNDFAVGTFYLLVPLMACAAVFAVASIYIRALSRLRETLILAAAAATSAFAINDHVLKYIFGRQGVETLLYRPQEFGFYPFQGWNGSPFPSGHMALVTATVAVLWKNYPKYYYYFVAALCCTASLLVVGEWHFFSDTIAGALWGFMVAEIIIALWRRAITELAL